MTLHLDARDNAKSSSLSKPGAAPCLSCSSSRRTPGVTAGSTSWFRTLSASANTSTPNRMGTRRKLVSKITVAGKSATYGAHADEPPAPPPAPAYGDAAARVRANGDAEARLHGGLLDLDAVGPGCRLPT